MIDTILQIERPYLSYPYHALEEIANENWENETVLEKLLNELRFRKTAFALYLKQKIEEQLKELESFRWVSTKAESGSGDLDTSDWKKDNLLSLLGYKSGSYGLDDARRAILDNAYTKPIPKEILPFVEDVKGWGMPNRATRLKKMADSIASIVRSEKGINTITVFLFLSVKLI
jgi:hypothetical protein